MQNNCMTHSSEIRQESIDPTQSAKRTVKILAIDGGGIRGIIPAKILQYIENNLKKNNTLQNVLTSWQELPQEDSSSAC